MANINSTNTLLIELKKLLDDICVFLSNEKNLSNSRRVHSQAKKTIEKLKHQSKVLAQIKEFPVEGESYVEMKGQSTPSNMYVEFEDSKDEIYCDISENANVEENKTVETTTFKEICPYLNRRYTDFINCRKKGVLSKREKLLIFDTNRKYFGLIYENYLLLYLNETDGQATHTLNLQQFHGSVVDENPKSFILINKNTKTPYIFFAVSHKDKLQWLAAINNKKVDPSNNSNQNTINNANTSAGLKIKEDLENDEIYELLEEEDYDRVDNRHLNLRSSNVKVCNKPLPKLPNLPTLPIPPLRPKPTQSLNPAILIRPTSSSDHEEDIDNEKPKADTSLSKDDEEDHYDIVCAPRLSRNRLSDPTRTQNTEIASVHPSVVSDLNRFFNKQVDRPPLMKKACSQNIEHAKNPRCSSGEYYDSIVGPDEISEPKEDIQVSQEDIYDSVVNVLPTQMMPHTTIDELKYRLQKNHQANDNTQDDIKPTHDDIKKPVTKAEEKVEKSKSFRKKFIFFKEAPVTKII